MDKDIQLPDISMNTTGIRRARQSAYNRLGFAYFVLCFTSLIGSFIYSLIALAISEELLVNENFTFLLNALCLYCFALPFVWLVLRTIPTQTPTVSGQEKMGVGRLLLYFLIGYFIISVFAYLGVFINYLITLILPDYDTASLFDMSGVSTWAYLLYGVIIAPVMEELLFRWLPYKKLARYGEGSYVFYTAIAFGLFHENLDQFFFAMAIGVLYAAITYRTGKMRYSVILHMLNNLIASLNWDAIKIPGLAAIGVDFAFLVDLALMLAGMVAMLLFCIIKRKQLRQRIIGMIHSTKAEAFINFGTVSYYLYASLSIITLILMIGLFI